MRTKSILTGVLRGFSGHCPECGKGTLFRGFLKIQAHCEVCGSDNEIYPADDMPPYVTFAIIGHIVVPLFMWFDAAYALSLWTEAAIWLPLTAISSLFLLPHVKGGVVGLCWANDLKRSDAI